MYICLIGCESKKERFEIGDKVPKDAFSKKTVEHFIAKGVLGLPKGAKSPKKAEEIAPSEALDADIEEKDGE